MSKPIDGNTRLAIFWLAAIGFAWLFQIFSELGFFIAEVGHGKPFLAVAVVATIWSIGQLVIAHWQGRFDKSNEEKNVT